MDAMISLQCSSSEVIAKELNAFLRNSGYSTWICIEMDGGELFREAIVVNASDSKTMIALMNTRWAESKECRYEFNIATRSLLTKGFPQIIPIIMENFDFNKYPLIAGIMANTNAIFYNPSNPSDTWGKVVAALKSHVQPSSPPVAAPVESVTRIVTEVITPLPEKLQDWKTSHIVQWLATLDFVVTKDAFVNNWVNGRTLVTLTQEDLKESLKFTGAQAKRMLLEIEDLKNSIISHKPIIAVPVPSVKPPAAAPKSPAGKPVAANVGKPTAAAARKFAPNPQISEMKSKSGFFTGVWDGYYQYQVNGVKEPTAMDVTMINGIIAGYGTDLAGDFLIQGVYDDNKLSCVYEKAYVGKHTVHYTGSLVKGKTITGKWYIKGEEEGEINNEGQFQLTLKASK